jgi:predicted O-methyltransferase YrrM
MPYAATSWLDRWLQPGMTAFEYGSGGSTLWLAERVGRLTSVEHDRGWYEAVDAELRCSGIKNCTLALKEPEAPARSPDGSAYASEVIPATFEAYVRAVEDVPGESLDIVVIDGRSRSAALEASRDKVRPGGLLVLDDSDRERYQPAQQKLAGWRHHRFHGIKPFVVKPAVTSVWEKPG